MARRKARRGVTRKAQAKRPRRPGKRKAPARSGGSAALAGARARIDELEAENRRLRRELAAARGEPTDDLGGDGNDAPLAPGM